MAFKPNSDVIYRNPGHWDVCTAAGRDFRIRGEAPNVIVYDERPADERPNKPNTMTFATVGTAFSWIADFYMAGTTHL